MHESDDASMTVRFCPSCGADLSAAPGSPKYCHKCGAALPRLGEPGVPPSETEEPSGTDGLPGNGPAPAGPEVGTDPDKDSMTEAEGSSPSEGESGADAEGPSFLTAEEAAELAHDLASEEARRAPERLGDERLARLSRRDRKRLRKMVARDLDRQLSEIRGESRKVARELRRADRARGRRARDVYRDLRQRSKESASRATRQRAARSRATEVIDAIGYERMFANGLCEVEDGVFAVTLDLDDITYQNARESDQKSILRVISDLLNYLPATASAQWSVANVPLVRDELESRCFFAEEGADPRPADAAELNKILNEKLRQGVSNLRRERTLTISMAASDADDAWRRLSRIVADVTGPLEQIRCSARVLDGREWLSRLASVLRPGRTFDFDYDRDITTFSALTTKDFVAPDSLDFRPDGETACYRSDGKWCQALVMRALPAMLEDTAVASLADLPIPLRVTWHERPLDKAYAVNFVRLRNLWIESEVATQQQRANRSGYSPDIIPPNLKGHKADAESLLDEVQGQANHLFEWCGLVWTWADDPETLARQVSQIIDTASAHGIDMGLLEYRQREAMNSVLPLASLHVDVTRYLTTTECCVLVPFATVELDDGPGSAWYYQNKLSNNLVLGRRSRLSSPVGFISGKTGSGKGFFTKNEIECTLLSHPEDQVIVIDRAGEYCAMCAHWHGIVATFGVGHDTRLNPFGMPGLEDRSDEAQIAFKTDAVLAQAGASAAEAGLPLTDEERSIIQRCVEHVFLSRGGAGDPTLEDLYEELRRQPEPEAERIALRYERFCHGAADFFNGASNVDFDATFVDLNLREIPESMIVFALVTMCEAVRYQMYANFARGRRTWLYVEEIESLFRYPTVLNYFSRLANESRKFGMFLTGITQSAEAMIHNPEASSIVKNSDFVVLLKQSKPDRDYWSDALSLSPLETSCIDESTPRGHGLLVFGGKRIPVRGDFPKGSYLYKLFSTDPNETTGGHRPRGLA